MITTWVKQEEKLCKVHSHEADGGSTLSECWDRTAGGQWDWRERKMLRSPRAFVQLSALVWILVLILSVGLFWSSVSPSEKWGGCTRLSLPALNLWPYNLTFLQKAQDKFYGILLIGCPIFSWWIKKVLSQITNWISTKSVLDQVNSPTEVETHPHPPVSLNGSWRWRLFSQSQSVRGIILIPSTI